MPKTFAALLAALVILVSVPMGASASTQIPVAKTVSLSGRLEYVTSYGVPHFEVTGYVLVSAETAALQALQTREVTVEGTELAQPSLFMRKALKVERIIGHEAVDSAPSPGLSGPKSNGGTEHLPVLSPFFGTSSFLLFGRLEAVDGTYYLIDPGAAEATRVEVVSGVIQLKAMLGEQVGVVADRELLPDGRMRYRVHRVEVVTHDLADRIQTGSGVIFVAPKGEVTVRLRGRIVNLDQAPIIGNGRTMVSLRAVAEAMGALVEWDGMTQTVTVTLGMRQVVVKIGSNRVVLREPGRTDTVISADIVPVIVGGRTLVPARVLSEGLGLSVNWAHETRTVEVN